MAVLTKPTNLAIVIDKNNSSCLETVKDEKYMKRLKKMKEMAKIFNERNVR